MACYLTERDKLQAAMDKVRDLNSEQLTAFLNIGRRTHISARNHRGVELIAVEDIRYFQADQGCVTIRHGGGEILIWDTLRELEEEFDSFIRVHRNALVSGQYIEGLERTDGHYQVRLRDVEELIDVSRRHLPSVRHFVRNL